MILGKLLAEELKERGIYKIYIGYEKPSLQNIAVKMLVKNYGFVKREISGKRIGEIEGISLYKGKGDEKVDFAFTKGGEKIPIKLPKYPLIVIDMSLFNELDEEEKKKTLLQVNLTLHVIRKFLWDGNLALINSPNISLGKARNIDNIETDNCIVLDPYGDIIANEEIIRRTDVFIIGGIVDKGRRLKHATSKLAEKYPCKKVKITLRGSIVGVPDEINKITDIILAVKFGKDIEKAIIETQSNSDKIARILVDVNQRGLEILEEEIKWLNANQKVYKLILKRLGIKAS
ncbi:tRNA (adenine(9)-N1)-methyltransferase Trm10 [Sulfurisphaera ohwakuensis]|uniref:tRNA (Adenine9-N1/guanine9-N1)-methyltransferase n=1 Tax=Sulfurisphaera ohwakuensis TaxID=69656 RepID=A0A650CFD6_SULOH|nr:tRNA (adenine(9)-N1)-methyltransferase Trm10 [Sulfurisphaera ohwakuensis]MBB5255037.1 tRNA (adenine9-N1/guanine9-N1)-methyltransferase [Sulfurisphaera ohwakuensis]QGR16573.1 tRNA methyltransferase [Sulfurisphaera ohwakuensis]